MADEVSPLVSAESTTETAATPTPSKVRGRPFQPGQSGNPSGRPKGETMAQVLRRLGALKSADLKKLRPANLTQLEVIARQALMRAATPRGERDRLHVFDRLDGKPAQSVALFDPTKQDVEDAVDQWRALLEANGASDPADALADDGTDDDADQLDDDDDSQAD